MHTDRSCLAATAVVSVLLLLTAARYESSSPPPPPPWSRAADGHVCCTTTSGWTDRKCTHGNRTFHTVETIRRSGGGGDGEDLCLDGDENATAVHFRKCCPPGRTYDASVRFCRPLPATTDVNATAASASRRLLLMLLLPRPPETTVAYDYEPPACKAGHVLVDVLVDVPADEVRRLLSPPSADPTDYCFDFVADYEGLPGREPGFVARTCRPRDQYCHRDGRYTCANKCCKGDKAIVGKTCKKSDVPFQVHVYDDRADNKTLLLARSSRVVLPYYQRLNCSNRDKLLPDEFVLSPDGSIYRPGPGVRLPATQYCLENERQDGHAAATMSAFVCAVPFSSSDVHDNAGSWKYAVILAGYVPSIVCLVLTLIVYAALSSLRNVHGYYVMCYVACLLVSFVCLLIIQWVVTESGMCKFFGYLTLFAFLTTFCWLNVISFDIYWMVRYNNPINKNKTISVRTILYNIYCWGFSSSITLTGYIFQHSEDSMLLKFAPAIGITNCYFPDDTDYGTVIFFLLPLSIMLVANLILFVLTAVHCSKIKSELNRFKRTDSKTQRFQVDKEKFAVSIKLFLVMGISWSFEIISRIFKIQGIGFIWHFLDEINALQGVIVFVIFVAKRKVITGIQKKISGSFIHSESTKMNTISGSSHCGSAHKNNNNDF